MKAIRFRAKRAAGLAIGLVQKGNSWVETGGMKEGRKEGERGLGPNREANHGKVDRRKEIILAERIHSHMGVLRLIVKV